MTISHALERAVSPEPSGRACAARAHEDEPGRSLALSAVVPCFDEAENLRELTQRVLRVFDGLAIDAELILIDDGSRDGTGELARELARSDARVVALCHAQNRGIEAAWRSGFQASGGEHVVFLDADLQNRPEDIARLYQALLRSGADLAQGCRIPAPGTPAVRRILSRGLNALLNALFGMRLRDNKSGFVLGPREVIGELLDHRQRYAYFQSFIAVAAHAQGYAIEQVDTRFEARSRGASFIGRLPLRVVVRVLRDLARALREYRGSGRQRDALGRFLREPLAPETHSRPTSEREPASSPLRGALYTLYFLTFPLHKWLISRDAGHRLNSLRRSQWLPQAAIRRYQERRLRHLIRHAYRNAPYYRALFDRSGLRPGDVRTLEDLSRLPLLSKETLRRHAGGDMLARTYSPRSSLLISTSGSTGEPLSLRVDRAQLEMRWASTMRALEWTGWRFGDPQVRLWHQTLGMNLGQVLRERVDAFLLRRTFIPAFELRPDNLPAFLARLRRRQPVLIDGYAESLNLLARLPEAATAAGAAPRAIMSSGQTLNDEVRAAIERRFGAEVFDKYGSREFSGIAYECSEHAGYHVMAESYIVELLTDGRPSRPGEVGEIVITDLNNECVPLIRYRIGDLALALPDAPCRCGRGLPRIGRIQGRVRSIVVCGDGTWLPGTFFAHFFKDHLDLVRHYQVHQSEPSAIELRVVKGERFSESGFERMLREFEKALGKGTRVDLRFVDRLPLGATGKRSTGLSALELDFQHLRKQPARNSPGLG